jgi:hypothetical protein
MELIREHGLGPWFYKKLNQFPEVYCSDAMFQWLYEDYRHSVVKCLKRESRFRALLEAFHINGIDSAILKGLYLAAYAYEEPALRTMNDVDILVHSDQFAETCELLQSLGYEFVERNITRFHELFNMPLTYKRQDNSPDLIDAHRVLRFMDYYVIGEADLWGEMRTGELFGHGIKYLSPEMNFIHIALHALNHRPILRDWVDLIMIIRLHDFSWDKLVGLAQSLGVCAPCRSVVLELINSWNIVPRESVLKELETRSHDPLETHVISGRFQYAWRLYSRIRSIKGFRDKLDYIRFRLSQTSVSSKLGMFLLFWRR